MKVKLIKLDEQQIKKFMMGDLVYVKHPEKGVCQIDYKNVHIGIMEESRQDKINRAVKYLEEQIEEIRTEMKYYNEDENFCPYKITDLTIRLNKSIEYVDIIKSLK